MITYGKDSGGSTVTASLGKVASAVESAVVEMEKKNLIGRIWAHDSSVWSPVDTEIADRLGWLHCPERMPGAVPHLTEFAEELRNQGFTDCLLLGMGGSSLAPEVCRSVFGVREGFLNVRIVDTTHPDSVDGFSRELRPESTFFLVSSKSGGTVETLSLMNYFYGLICRKLGREEAGPRFAAITDPGSGLEKTAGDLRFRKIFLNDPEIGGRYAALSYVGLVPAALIGVDVGFFLERAAEASAGGALEQVGVNSAAWLGAAMGVCARDGRNKLTLIASPSIGAFSAWLEQLIAESTGKKGKGIVPIVGEALEEPEFYGDDRLFVYLKVEGDDRFDRRISVLEKAGHPVIRITINSKYDLSGEFFRWEMATAVSGHVLGVNPFDQPDVESAKVKAKQAIEAFRREDGLPARHAKAGKDGIRLTGDFVSGSVLTALKEFIEGALSTGKKMPGGPYLAIQAYLEPCKAVDRALDRIRHAAGKRFRIPVTLGYGPQFLHSTGQLHKGGPAGGLFVQITSEPQVDVPIPDRAGDDASSVSFGMLIRAQALGDRQTLMDCGRDVLTVEITGDVPAEIERLAENI
ncbi:MAG TPA: glucose-6-phosphate isomerase [Desulfobacteraceae bacterium]|mgnify:CR=1 FL=1|nr:glucose-6-phosphate isomerase [Desulfobacteraceae bacterium]